MSAELLIAFVGVTLTIMAIVATATVAVGRAQALAERLGDRIDSLVLSINLLRKEFTEFALELRVITRDHESRLGEFEGGKEVWLAMRDRNGHGGDK